MSPALPALPWPPPPAAARFSARAFPARQDDLDLEFAGRDRPALVTDLLCACVQTAGRPLAPEQAWAWTAADRLQGLLAIATRSLGAELSALATCSAPDCGERFELSLALATFASEPPTALAWQSPGGECLRLALPTGELQRSWRDAEDGDERWLARRLVLAVDGEAPDADWRLPEGWLAGMATALAEADPLTALALPVPCPCCGRALEVEIDLESLVLEGLHQRQLERLEEVHQLARAYHWPEPDIIALPDWRRQHYLQRLAADLP